MTMLDEIREQPAVARRLLDEGQPGIASIARALRDRPIDGIVMAARGSSDHAAIYGQYLFGIRHRLVVGLATPSAVSVYGVVPRLAGKLVIGISQSGASPDIAGFVAAARREGAQTIALTNVPESALAQAAEHLVELRAREEHSLAATKTYTAELIALAMLSAALGGDPEGDLEGVPAALDAVLEIEDLARSVVATREDLDRCVVIGRGFEYGTAREWALKLKETALVMAEPFSAPDFEHGPRAIVRPGFPILAIAPSGAVLPAVRSLVERLRDEQGAELIVTSDDAEVCALGSASLRLPAGIPEWLMPIVSAVPGQLLAYHLARAKGLDPEAPPHLRKVTLTR